MNLAGVVGDGSAGWFGDVAARQTSNVQTGQAGVVGEGSGQADRQAGRHVVAQGEKPGER